MSLSSGAQVAELVGGLAALFFVIVTLIVIAYYWNRRKEAKAIIAETERFKTEFDASREMARRAMDERMEMMRKLEAEARGKTMDPSNSAGLVAGDAAAAQLPVGDSLPQYVPNAGGSTIAKASS
ncbi:hypothetical protein HDU93_001722 [Gonapodya sp. JEL0774]|nr:hypothetical protein HDU93_001722 [Gonapodya sp. JEL0774]